MSQFRSVFLEVHTLHILVYRRFFLSCFWMPFRFIRLSFHFGRFYDFGFICSYRCKHVLKLFGYYVGLFFFRPGIHHIFPVYRIRIRIRIVLFGLITNPGDLR